MRIPNPADLRPAGLEPARGIAQISEGVAGRIGQAGRQIGNAIESIGAAFGDVAQRQAATEDATNLARAKLDWYKFDNEAWTGLQNSVKEDGSGWERTPEIYDKGRQDIVARYPISDPKRREELNLYLEHQIAKRGFDAARQKQTQAGSYYRSIEDKEIDGAVARIEANPSQASVDAFRGPLGELVESGRGIYHSEATIEKRKREIEGKLLMGQYRGLIKQDPEAAAELFKRIQEGQYEIDTPRAIGGSGSLKEIDRTDSGLKNLGGIKPQGIIFHHTSGTTVDGAIDTLAKRGLSYNYLIDRDGTVHTIVPPEKGAQHMRPGSNGLESGNTIGISFVARNDGDVTDAQRAAGRALAARDAAKFGIGQDKVFGHGEVNSHKEHNEGKTDAEWIRKNGFAALGGEPKLIEEPRPVSRPGQQGQPDYSKAIGILEKIGTLDKASPEERKIVNDALISAGIIDDLVDRGQGRKAMEDSIATVNPKLAEKIRSGAELTDAEKAEVSRSAMKSGFLNDLVDRGEGAQNLEDTIRKTNPALADKLKAGKRGDDLTRDEHNEVQRAMGLRGNEPQPSLIDILKQKQQEAAGQQKPSASMADRSLTRYAGLKSSTSSDAVVIGETPTKGADGAANDNGGEGIQGLISEIRGVAKEAPHLPLSEVLDRETLTALADQFPEVASIEDFDNATVSDALKAMEGGDKQGKTLPPRADNMSPMGRLAGGQVFTVKSKVGDISVTAESLNALDRNMLKKLQSEAKEMSLIRQREGEAIAEDLVRKQLLTLENTGKNHSEFDPKLLAEVYRRNPKKIAEYERRAAIATQVHEATADATNLPNDILEARLDNLRTSIVDGAGDADPTAQAAFDRAEKRVKNLISIRERDPARAVRDSREVAEVRAQIPDGEPKNKAHLFQMADATIKAQTRLGIPVVPITKSEARTIMSDIIYAPENQKRAVAQETAKKINETYGSLAPQIMSAAIKLTSGDTRDDDDMLGSAMKRLQRQSTIKDVDNAVGATGGKKQDRVPSAPNYFDKFDKVK